MFRYTCFKERIFMAASGIYLFNLFLLSCKRESKTVALLRMSPNVFLETSKVFVWPHLHHCDITHDQAYKLAVHKKLQSFQFNAFLAVTGIIRGISREKLHQELGLELLQLSRWYKELCCFVKIYNSNCPDYFLIPTLHRP